MVKWTTNQWIRACLLISLRFSHPHIITKLKKHLTSITYWSTHGILPISISHLTSTPAITLTLHSTLNSWSKLNTHITRFQILPLYRASRSMNHRFSQLVMICPALPTSANSNCNNQQKSAAAKPTLQAQGHQTPFSSPSGWLLATAHRTTTTTTTQATKILSPHMRGSQQKEEPKTYNV